MELIGRENESLIKKNNDYEQTLKETKGKKKCPFDKICKSEGNINEKYKNHSVLNSCPERMKVKIFKILKNKKNCLKGDNGN